MWISDLFLGIFPILTKKRRRSPKNKQESWHEVRSNLLVIESAIAWISTSLRLKQLLGLKTSIWKLTLWISTELTTAWNGGNCPWNLNWTFELWRTKNSTSRRMSFNWTNGSPNCRLKRQKLKQMDVNPQNLKRRSMLLHCRSPPFTSTEPFNSSKKLNIPENALNHFVPEPSLLLSLLWTYGLHQFHSVIRSRREPSDQG